MTGYSSAVKILKMFKLVGFKATCFTINSIYGLLLTRTSHNQTGFWGFNFLLVRKFEIRNQKLETNPKSECFNDQNNIGIQRLPSHVPVFVIRILVIRFCFVFRASNFGFCYLYELTVLINFLLKNA